MFKIRQKYTGPLDRNPQTLRVPCSSTRNGIRTLTYYPQLRPSLNSKILYERPGIRIVSVIGMYVKEVKSTKTKERRFDCGDLVFYVSLRLKLRKNNMRFMEF